MDTSVPPSVIEFLSTRSSTPISAIGLPAPSDDEIETMVRIASRVPDHGRLTPWRFILYRGEAREQIGQYLVDLAEEREGLADRTTPRTGTEALRPCTPRDRRGLLARRTPHSGMGAVPVFGCGGDESRLWQQMRLVMPQTGSATGMPPTKRAAHCSDWRRMNA